MNKRTTMVLGGIAVAMLAYILIFERGSLTTGEIESRHGRVIESFVRARVTRMEITAGGTHVVLVRDTTHDDEETLETFGVGDWSLEAPVHARADSESVDGLISSLEWLDARRTIEGVNAADRTRFGFDAPTATVAFTVANEQHRLLIGGEDPRGEGLYVSVDAGDTAWIVGRDIVEALQHDTDHFRSKELFHGLRLRDAVHVEITNASAHAVAERSENDEGHMMPWRLTSPISANARISVVDGLLQFATHARATRFLAETAAADLPASSRELRIERSPAEPGAEGDEADRSPLRLRVLDACPDHADEVRAVIGDGPVICLLASDLEPLDVPLERLRETRLLSSGDDRVDTLTLASGSSTFTIRRVEGGFRIGEGDDAPTADGEALSELLHALRAAEAQEFVAVEGDVVAAHGLASPATTLTITRTDDEPDEVVTFGTTDAVGIWARRGDEAQVGRYDLSVRALVAQPSIAFRDRHLADRDADDATNVRIVRGAETEVVAHESDGWHVTEPTTLVASEPSVRDVTRAIGGLEALRFVADAASTAHGLDHPRYVATVHFAAPEHHEHEDDDEEEDQPVVAAIDLVLHVGAATDGGAFATLGDAPAVFVVAQALVDALAHPLASHDLLAIPTGDISALTITSPNGTVALREQGDGWVTDLGPAATGPATAMFDRLASLHATTVESYGSTMPTPTITIEATHRSGATPTRIEIGPVAADASPYRLARITGVAAVFRIPDEAAAAFADYRP
jgi:hypothetical protein